MSHDMRHFVFLSLINFCKQRRTEREKVRGKERGGGRERYLLFDFDKPINTFTFPILLLLPPLSCFRHEFRGYE